MNPAFWTFVAMALLLTGSIEIVRAPRRRVAQVLERTHTLRNGSGEEVGALRAVVRFLEERFHRYLPSSQMEELREKLLWAGQPLGLRAEEFIFARLGCALAAALASPAVTGLIGVDVPVTGPMAIGGALGYMIPEKWVNFQVEERTRQIRIALPVFVNLLATALEAGLPIVEAVRRVASEQVKPGQRQGLLSAEMLRTVQEMAAGKQSTAAWQHLMHRTNCQELRDVVGAIIQSQDLGVGVAEQLRFHMRTIRTKKQQEATDRAQAASVQMKIPIIVLIVLPTMVMLVGPALMGMLQVFTGG